MQRIYLLSTGGTIEKVYSEQSGAVENRAAKLDRYLRMLRLPDAEIRTMHLMNKDSLEMTDADRAEVRDRVAELLSESAPIVISHGTDTMVETGLFLEKAFARSQGADYSDRSYDASGIRGQRRSAKPDREPACRALALARRLRRHARTGLSRRPGAQGQRQGYVRLEIARPMASNFATVRRFARSNEVKTESDSTEFFPNG